MRQRLIMTKTGRVQPARMKISAMKAYTPDELRGEVSKFFREAEIGVKESLTARLVLLTFFSWLEEKEEK